MFETIGVLVVFFFLLAIAGTLYTKIQKSNLEKEIKRQSELAATQIAERAFFMPELDCTFLAVKVPNCFDTEKIKAFESLEDTKKIDVYFPSFGQSKIQIKKIWPTGEAPTQIYKYEPTKKGSELLSRSPVLLYDAKPNKYYFGVIEVTAYVK